MKKFYQKKKKKKKKKKERKLYKSLWKKVQLSLSEEFNARESISVEIVETRKETTEIFNNFG